MAARAPRRVIIDTDPGVDDALALLLAFRSPELHVVGLTTVCGNVPVDLATRNVFRVLQLVEPPPGLLVGQGAERPLRRTLQCATAAHGLDGLGELDRFLNADGTPCYPEPACPSVLPSALDVWECCDERDPGELTLVTLGPLTNVAHALAQNEGLVRRFREIICMAGAIAVPGNVTAVAEFNVWVDPEAAQHVCEARLPVTLIPLDVTTQVAMDRAALAALGVRGGRLGQFLAHVTDPALAFMERTTGCAVFHFHDPVAVAAAIDPTLVGTMALPVAVETEGRLTTGMTVGDRRIWVEALRPPPTLHAALRVDAQRALQLILDGVCPG